ncbi:MAG: SDR family NAD(P)-dependent oxidoreductase [Acidobacteriota bacterium]
MAEPGTATQLSPASVFDRDSVAVVTGASRGVGRAVARSFAAKGLRVMLAARSADDLRALDDELTARHGDGRVAHARCDLRSADDIGRLADATREHFGGCDVLVSNAGIGWYKPFLEHTTGEIDDLVRVDLTAPMLLAHAFLPGMIERRRGLIVHVASDLARRFLPKMAPYVAAKFGLLGFSGSLLREVKEHGVKVTTVLPGLIDTSFGGDDPSAEGSRDDSWALRPEELAARIADLLELPPHVVIDELAVHPLHQDF